MIISKKNKGRFTLPGESGHEALTLELAERWGADVIRDSDGTQLSDEILEAGFDIYSTVCIIRNHNRWAKENPTMQQQTFLMTRPIVATEPLLTIPLMADYFDQQFAVNKQPQSLKYWQVFDRTTNTEVPRNQWEFDGKNNTVVLREITPWHKYTVNFLAFRIWEEISMYNLTTNNWNSEHLMQVDPIHPEAQRYLLDWMEQWCQEHTDTDVVRFTSLFYNFVWIWGSDERNRHLFTDWASYDFTVSPYALELFEQEYGIAMTSEDFINKGNLRSTHTVPDQKKRLWMEFIGDFVIRFGKQLIDIAHNHGKKAYVFYDDSWVGLEPYSGRFSEFGFDGLIKCVFSGFEVRLCTNVEVETHELRLHPYLFPTGLGGHPTFMEGGDPKRDAQEYWRNIRRALLIQPVQRLGLGGYLSLVEDFPEFVDYIEELTEEFHAIVELHEAGAPQQFVPKIGVLTTWGKLRTWTLSGHFHETEDHDLIHILESLSGLPFAVEFYSFEEFEDGLPKDLDIIINAGVEGSAWSGGEGWDSHKIVEHLTRWVYEGGVFLGVNEPSALPHQFDTQFRMAHVLGVDKGGVERSRHGKWEFAIKPFSWIPEGAAIQLNPHSYLTDGKANVHLAKEDLPLFTSNSFGKGKGLYLASYQHSAENTKFLRDLLLWSAGGSLEADYLSSSPYVECVSYPASKKFALINNSDSEQTTSIRIHGKERVFTLPPFGMSIEESK